MTLLQDYLEKRFKEIQIENLQASITKLIDMHQAEVISKRRRNNLGRILKASQEKLATMKVG